MAPGAKWIGCRNMDRGAGTPARYIECMQFFLAPYPVGGGQGDPTLAPDVTINSWGCPPSEGCSANTLQAAVEAQAAAGIMMVVAAGNSGSNCSTVTDPPSDRKSTRLNSSHSQISYAVFCLKKKKNHIRTRQLQRLLREQLHDLSLEITHVHMI